MKQSRLCSKIKICEYLESASNEQTLERDGENGDSVSLSSCDRFLRWLCLFFLFFLFLYFLSTFCAISHVFLSFLLSLSWQIFYIFTKNEAITRIHIDEFWIENQNLLIFNPIWHMIYPFEAMKNESLLRNIICLKRMKQQEQRQ